MLVIQVTSGDGVLIEALRCGFLTVPTCGRPLWDHLFNGLLVNIYVEKVFSLYTVTSWLYTVSQKNCPTLWLFISSSNIDRFSKFFYWHILWTSSSSAIIKHTTTP